jgi:basic amino acid/polyamine antiporter, APA family
MRALAPPTTALAERTSQIVLFMFMLMNIAVIRIKLRDDDLHSHFRVPMVVPVFGVLTNLLRFGAAFFYWQSQTASRQQNWL